MLWDSRLLLWPSSDGIDPKNLFRTFDGIHPSLDYASFMGDAFYTIMEQRFPGFLGHTNPSNGLIEATFGNQGGY